MQRVEGSLGGDDEDEREGEKSGKVWLGVAWRIELTDDSWNGPRNSFLS